jgi:DNA-binding NarL/FixJ family response regulator
MYQTIADLQSFRVVALRKTCFACGAPFDATGRERKCKPCRKPAERTHRERQQCLSFRQQQIVSLLRRGMLNKEIAYELRLSEGTIKEYMREIFRKTGARNRVELAMWAVDQEQRCA